MGRNSRIVGIIPARYNSKRFPGKLLADLNGKPIIQHTWEQANKAKRLNLLVIATDSPEIAPIALHFGALVSWTPNCRNGTERVAKSMSLKDIDIIVNIQGDEPFIHPSAIDDLVKTMLLHADIQVATLYTKVTKEEALDTNVVKVFPDRKGYAKAFSRNAISEYKHIGIYAYRKDFLLKFMKLPISMNEGKKDLEQLRILDNGYKIKLVKTKYNTIAIDTPADLEKARRYINEL